MKVKVKIAVAANKDGDWQAYGFQNHQGWEDVMDSFDSLPGEKRFWVEAEVEVTDEEETVAGQASSV